jgi:NAD(P)-dependent dehydrogenase (short-subunit alcohol dehydrogenase family)
MAEHKVAVVAGGTGGIGEGIVAALMEAGYRVYVPTRAGDQSERLRSFVAGVGDLRTIQADLCNEDEVRSLKDQILAEEERVDAVVVSVGAYYYGHRMHRMPRDDWDRSIQDNLVTHFNLQRIFIDLLRKQDHGVYVALVGPEAESIHPDEGVMSIMAAAQKMMARVIAQEAFDSEIRVYAITAHTSVRTRSRGEAVNPDWITARELGDYVTALAEGALPAIHDTVHELSDHEHVQSLLKRARTSPSER